jgi:hypothetical protein
MIALLHRNSGEMKASECSEEHISDMTFKGKEQIDLPILHYRPQLPGAGAAVKKICLG